MAWNWGLFFRALADAVHDLRSNTAPPAAPAGGSLIDVLNEVEADLPAIVAYVAAHPGEITAAADVLQALSAEGLTWAAPLRDLLLRSPALLAEAESWLAIARSFAPDPSLGRPLDDTRFHGR